MAQQLHLDFAQLCFVPKRADSSEEDSDGEVYHSCDSELSGSVSKPAKMLRSPLTIDLLTADDDSEEEIRPVVPRKQAATSNRKKKIQMIKKRYSESESSFSTSSSTSSSSQSDTHPKSSAANTSTALIVLSSDSEDDIRPVQPRRRVSPLKKVTKASTKTRIILDSDSDDFEKPVPFLQSRSTKGPGQSSKFDTFLKSVDEEFGGLTLITRKTKKCTNGSSSDDSEERKPRLIEKKPKSRGRHRKKATKSSSTDDEENLDPNQVKISHLPLTDPLLETLDPNPDIQQLFKQYDRLFFSRLLSAEGIILKWAQNLTSSGGNYSRFTRTIKLSGKLLAQRPRADLVNTLLHEMIHAYVHLKYCEKGHGGRFKSEMARINQSAGTAITVYHTWREEVKALKKYVWRCSGPLCRNYGPKHGQIALTNQRAPNRFDYAFRWHETHACTGVWLQISGNFTNAKNDAQEDAHTKNTHVSVL